MRVGSGATEQFVDYELILDLKDRIMNLTLLEGPNTILIATTLEERRSWLRKETSSSKWSNLRGTEVCETFEVNLSARNSTVTASTTPAVALTATYQPHGVSEYDELVVAIIPMCMPQDSNNTS